MANGNQPVIDFSTPENIDQSGATVTAAAPTIDFSAPEMQEREEAGLVPGLARSFIGQGIALGAGDEIEAFARSRLPGGGTYEEELEKVRSELRQFQEENPVLSTGAEIAGAFVLPGGAAVRGATMGARALRSAAVGGATGAISGAATSEGDLIDRASGAVQGAGFGALTGAAAVPVVEGVIRGGARLARAAERAGAPIRGMVNPRVEAARRVAIAREADRPLGGGISPQAARAAQAEGLPVTNLELGGEMTRGLARSAANQSAEGRALLDRTINDRFEGQGGRLEESINSLFPGRADSFTRREQLRAAARRANRPAYARAYEEGSGSLRSPELDRLLGSPLVAGALGRAATRGRDRAVAEGFGAFNPSVTVTPDGRIKFRQSRAGLPVFPDLRLWDYAQRELRDAASAARRSGRNEQAATFEQLGNQLRDELDRLVPSFARARGTARSFFQAEDALEAGQNFARQTNFRLPEARRALGRMSQPERELFAEGFADQLVSTINRTRDRTNVINRIWGNQDSRNRIRLALGNRRAAQLERRIRVEQLMDMARSAVQGNSTTTRQLVELGLVGGGAGAVTGFDPTSMVASALLWRGGRRLRDRTNERVARRVAELLVSDDPNAINRALQQITRTPALLRNLRRFDDAFARVGGLQAGQLTSGTTEDLPQ